MTPYFLGGLFGGGSSTPPVTSGSAPELSSSMLGLAVAVALIALSVAIKLRRARS